MPEGPGGQNIFMHYNFIESQNSPASDPLTLWQQGGPGSSGFGFGYMAELGPFHLSAESMSNMTDEVPNLWQNPYSWGAPVRRPQLIGGASAECLPLSACRSPDTLSNILILEHPPGTGFSYCAHQNGTPTECQWNDDTRALPTARRRMHSHLLISARELECSLAGGGRGGGLPDGAGGLVPALPGVQR